MSKVTAINEIIEKRNLLRKCIVNIYTKPADCTFAVVYVYLKKLED